MRKPSVVRTIQAAPLLTIGVLFVSAMLAAAPLLPPSLSIRLPQNAVAVVTVMEVVDAERVRFRRDQVLQEDRVVTESGEEPPGEVVVRVGEELVGSLEVGDRFILGYTSVVPVESWPHTFSPDPDGPQVAIMPAVGPALLENSASLLQLVTPRPSDAELAPRERLDLILTQIERPDPMGRLFVLAEMVLWTELRPELTPQDVERFRQVMDDGALEARSQEYFLRAFFPVRDKVGEAWMADQCRRVLAERDSQMDLLSANPSLVKMALESLAEIGAAEDAVAVLEFLDSNNEAVSVQAFRTAAALDPELTGEVVGPLVFIGDLPEPTERAAIRFLAERQAEQGPGEDSD